MDKRLIEKEAKLSLDRLKEILEYNPDTGIFISKVRRNGRNGDIGNRAGSLRSNGYILISIDYIKYRAHRLAWFYVNGSWPVDQIDHIDNNRSNNRISNLREATNQQQSFNTKLNKRNSSGYKGVFWDKREKKWRSQLKINCKTVHLGYYKTPEEAHEAYKLKSDELFGEFANHG